MERKSLTLMAVATLLVASGAFGGSGVTGAASPSGGATNIQAPNSPQHFQDVPPSSPFYAFVQSHRRCGDSSRIPMRYASGGAMRAARQSPLLPPRQQCEPRADGKIRG